MRGDCGHPCPKAVGLARQGPAPYCAARRDEGGLRWDPFQDGSFKAWTCGKIVRVWDSPEPWPTRDMIQAWLLLRFSRTRTRTPLN